MNGNLPSSTAEPTRVAIVANYTADAPGTNNRFNDLARRFAARGAEVELITTDFSHDTKARIVEGFGEPGYTITRLREPGYRKNISVARLRSQAAFARAVGAHLDSLARPPHVLLAAVPPPAVGDVCARYARKVGAVFATDIQDVWPEAFSVVARKPLLIDTLFRGMRKASKNAYRSSDLIVGVSETFTDSAISYGADPTRTRVVHLGTDLGRFDQFARIHDSSVADSHDTKAVTIGYVGSLSTNYDLKLVIDALERLSHDLDAPVLPRLVVMGEGENRKDFEEHARGKDLDIRFTGRLPYAEMVRTLTRCDIAVNPLVPGFGGSIINKVCDYAAAGLPVVNSQESPEYRSLLEDYQAGISCAPSDVRQMADALRRLTVDSSLRRRMGVGSRRMAEERFDRSATYEKLVDELLALAVGIPAGR